jgi:hypothetical protein
MGAGVFVIQEFRRIGASTFDIEGYERFEWISDSAPASLFGGGARAAPVGTWDLAGKLRTVRTDYPGAKTPSEQVLGPSNEPFTLEGMWQDKYNFAGYAVKEMLRFEAMCKRGNPVRFQFQAQVFEGLITEWSFPYRGEFEISYRFTVSNHGRPGEDSTTRSPETALSAGQAFDAADIVSQAMFEEHKKAPRTANASTFVADTESKLGDIAGHMDALANSIDTRKGGLRPIHEFNRLATQFRIVAGSASDVVMALIAVRSDIDLGVRTAIEVLNFESYTRTMRFNARLLLGTSNKSAKDMAEHAQPTALRIYEAFSGESLYHVSRVVYGTPHAWRLIADRNGLTSLVLTGDERLIIPERGGG